MFKRFVVDIIEGIFVWRDDVSVELGYTRIGE